MDVTPKYKIPYLTEADKADDWPPYYKKLADKLEAVIDTKSGGTGTSLGYVSATTKVFQYDHTYTVAPLTLVKASPDFTVGTDSITVLKAGVYWLSVAMYAKGGDQDWSRKCSAQINGISGWSPTPDGGGRWTVQMSTPAVLQAGASVKVAMRHNGTGASGETKLPSEGGSVTIFRLGDV